MRNLILSKRSRTKPVQHSCSFDETEIDKKSLGTPTKSARKTEPNAGGIYRYFHHVQQVPIMITDALTDVHDRFCIQRKVLGRGRYGIVRKCMEREMKGKYAIKSIRKSRVKNSNTIRNEMEILQEVNHPNIIQFKDVYEDELYLHLITELCTGGGLFDRIIDKWQTDEGHYSEEHAAEIIHSILDAIAYCHDQKGIVHCDLKPENVMFATPDDDAPIKIIDFGMSRHDTKSGDNKTCGGTGRYVAPEVLNGKYTKSSDIWSIGVIAYILLCGYAPFEGESDVVLFKSIMEGKFDFPLPDWGNISYSAKDFICSLLNMDPTQRPTASEAMKHRWVRQHVEKPVTIFNLPRPHLFNYRKRSLDKLSHYM